MVPISHIFSKNYTDNSCLNLIILESTKAELNVVLQCYFNMILKAKHFEKAQVKHKNEFTSSETQYNDMN